MKATRSKDLFRFKQFEVRQDRCAMKVSTDAVVLGALVAAENSRTALDIGVGTGVISLMLTQRFPQLLLTGVELEIAAYEQATQNVAASPWNNRIELKSGSIQDYAVQSQNRFDLIVTNPPYYPDHLLSPDQTKNTAHHGLNLSFQDLRNSIENLLSPTGDLWVILPVRQMIDFTDEIAKIGLHPVKETVLIDRPEKNPLRSVVNFSFNKNKLVKNFLYIKNSDGNYSDAYSDLLKEFLLIF